MEICGKEVKIDGKLLRIARLDGEKYNSPGDLEEFLKALKKSKKRVDLFSFMQGPPQMQPKYSYPMEWDNLAVLPVSTFDNWWNNQIRSFPRNRARQAHKRGVTFREVPFGDELLKGICGIYNETPVRQGKPFAHYGMTMEKARSYAGTYLDRTTYLGAFVGEVMIGFVKLTTDETRSYVCMVHILSMVAHKEKAPTNALVAESVRYCEASNIPYLIYENFSYGKKTADSLAHFKEVNGFQRMDLPRYYIPLTQLGSAAYRLGFHHRLAKRIPESLASRFRNARRVLYDRKAPAAVSEAPATEGQKCQDSLES